MHKSPSFQIKISTKSIPIALVLVFVLSLAVPSSTIARPLAPPSENPSGQVFQVEVVSSAPDQVTGGDARLHIQVPWTVPLHQVEVWVNGVDQADHFTPIEKTRTLSGVIDGLDIGENMLVVRPNGKGKGRPDPVYMVLTNYPISGPVFSGPHQYPFVCTAHEKGLGPLLVDNDSEGIPVYDDSVLLGYSKDCSVATKVEYVYRSISGSWKSYVPGSERPEDIAQTTTLDGLTVDYIVRWERGTINRFIYSIAVLAPFDRGPNTLDTSAWNKRLIFAFQGGVAIGHSQGSPSNSTMLYADGLSKGYAIIYSTGNRTDTHYNLIVGGETALMTKERFIELYDLPLYTVGVGGSGGAIQQYVYGQNHPGLLDAAIPQYSYPDMVTQAIHVGDCELLEFYMDVLDAGNPRWSTWSNRTLIEGMNASDTVINPYTGGLPGASECVMGWRGLSPLALNPLYGAADYQDQYVPPSAIAGIEWSHFGDIVNVVGVADDGYARNYWDNVGVQYGLGAVASGQITPEEFLQLNAIVGGWKNEPDMVQEGCPFYPPGCTDLSRWDPWSARNQVFSVDPLTSPAPRTEGDLQAIQAVYESGLVFHGEIDIPIIDWRHYLEDELNMHNTHQSFASRQRIRDFKGNSDNQVIWFTDVENGPQFDQTPEALEVMDEWMLNILADPELGVAANKPARAVDRCFDAYGNEIAAGDDVWNGILDDNPPGACTQQFQLYSTSRIVAGGPIRGGVFKCQLMPVTEAIARGEYGVWTPSPGETAMLMAIFPSGVCDYSLPDAGLPPGW